jgi:hypothetical protein
MVLAAAAVTTAIIVVAIVVASKAREQSPRAHGPNRTVGECFLIDISCRRSEGIHDEQ